MSGLETSRRARMSAALKSLLLAILIGASGVGARAQAPVVSEAQTQQEMEGEVLRFRLTDEKFETFRRVALYRQSSRLDVLPGFPENPTLDRAAAELGADAGTMERLAHAQMGPRDYVLTGWALVLAHDPEEWGLSGDRLTDAMRRNVEFVRTHVESVEALLRSG